LGQDGAKVRVLRPRLELDNEDLPAPRERDQVDGSGGQRGLAAHNHERTWDPELVDGQKIRAGFHGFLQLGFVKRKNLSE
jgi:hypothetical protein